MRMNSFTRSLKDMQSPRGGDDDNIWNLDDNVEFDDCPQVSDGGCAENPLVYSTFQLFRGNIP